MPGSIYNSPCVTENCKRKRRYRDGGCEPCHYRMVQEGTAPKFASPAYEKRVKLVRDYNKLIRKGMKQHEIAKLWGMDRGCLSAHLFRAKRDSGLKVINGSTVRWAEPTPKTVATKQIRSKVSGHGEGKLGVPGCKCDPCLEVRRATRRDTDGAYRRRRREREAAAKEQGTSEMT